MKITESELRSLSRKIMSELFTKKSPLKLGKFIDRDVDDMSFPGGVFDIGEADDIKEEEVTEADEELTK